MDETLIRGLIVGGALGAVALAASLIWKLMRSPTEGARRLRLVLGIGGVAVCLFAAAKSGEMAGTLVVLAVIGAVVWVIRGAKK